MVYFRNEPVASDDLDVSQPKLLVNTNGADDSFGIDHYRFSNASVNNGMHNQVTTPQYFLNTNVSPVYPTINVATTTNPILFASQPTNGAGTPTTNIGLLQYSRGASNAVPSPVTNLQSPAAGQALAPAGTINVLDFTGLNICMAYLSVFDSVAPANTRTFSAVYWTGAALSFHTFSPIGTLVIQVAGSILQIRNNAGALTSVFWAMNYMRIQ